jgi:hypothetical protein
MHACMRCYCCSSPSAALLCACSTCFLLNFSSALLVSAVCRHGPKRPDYLADFWKVLSWQAVSRNYAAAAAGNINALVA